MQVGWEPVPHAGGMGACTTCRWAGLRAQGAAGSAWPLEGACIERQRSECGARRLRRAPPPACLPTHRASLHSHSLPAPCPAPRPQRDLLSRLLQRSPEGAALRAACACQVLSVDACQGDEADAVVVSTVRAQSQLSRWAQAWLASSMHIGMHIGNVLSPTRACPCALPSPHTLASPHPHVLTPATQCSFFRDRQRINVAMSRARHLCIVCGHRDVLALPRAQPWGRILASYRDAA